MLSASAHILARLQRDNQARRLIDSKLERQIQRAITLRQDGKLNAAAEVEREIAAYLDRQKKVNKTTEQAISALNRALREGHNGKSEISVTITVKGGTPAQKARITSLVVHSARKAVKTAFVTTADKTGQVIRSVRTAHPAIVLPIAAFLTLLLVGGIGSHAANLTTGFHCTKTPIMLGYCPQKRIFLH